MGVCVIGSLNLDIVCRVEVLPRPGETVAGRGVERLPGGKGANQAAAAARCGSRTTLIGAVGTDDAGDFLLGALHGAGVVTDHVARMANQSTGQAFIWVSDAGENSIVVVSGANAALGPDAIEPAALEGSVVFLTQLESPVEAIEAVFASAPARAGIRILNAAPAAPAGRRLFPLTDILIVNETELAVFAALAAVPETAEDIAAAARRLITRADQTVVVTLGKAGALAVASGGVSLVPGRLAKVVDTTGAGDCFCGVLAARLADGAALDEAMAWANAAAALSTERAGAVPAMPTRAAIEAVLTR